jgi:DNA processing protein
VRKRNYIAVTNSLLQIKGIGPAKLLNATSSLSPDASTLIEISEHYCHELNLQKGEVLDSPSLQKSLDCLQTLPEDCAISCIFENEYPESLKGLKTAPPFLVYRGALPTILKAVALIGSRFPERESIQFTATMVDQIRMHGFSVCNGMAAGIDSVAIERAIDTETSFIGVAAGGITGNVSEILSKGMANQASRILDTGGVLVSEYLFDVKETTYTVIASCRLHAGLASALVLVQSGESGGSLYAVKAAEKIRIPIGIFSSYENHRNQAFAGNHELLHRNNNQQDSKRSSNLVHELRIDSIDNDFSGLVIASSHRDQSLPEEFSQPGLF